MTKNEQIMNLIREWSKTNNQPISRQYIKAQLADTSSAKINLHLSKLVKVGSIRQTINRRGFILI